MTGVDFGQWARLAGDSATSRSEWAAVVDDWSQPHRRYHDLAHLAAVLGLVDTLAAHAADPAAVSLAAWYHDVVYDPQRSDNEEASASRARVGLRGLVPGETIEEVCRLVLVTTAHDPADDDRNGAVLCDADLAVLAAPPDAYAAYASAVREEYAHYDDATFTAGRISVCEQLLDLPTLYRTTTASGWTDRARANLVAELTVLRARAGGWAHPAG